MDSDGEVANDCSFNRMDLPAPCSVSELPLDTEGACVEGLARKEIDNKEKNKWGVGDCKEKYKGEVEQAANKGD